MNASTAPAAAITRTEIEELLYEEAARLDDGQLDRWLELFTDDARYWLPMAVEDPAREPSLVHDDRARMEERVFRLMDSPAYAQMPPSRTQHDVTNVRLVEADHERARATSNLVVHEVRVGDPSQVGLATPRSLPGRCEYAVRRTGRGLLIEDKIVRLQTRELPQYNLTFIV